MSTPTERRLQAVVAGGPPDAAASCPTTRARPSCWPRCGRAAPRSAGSSPTTFVEIGAWCGKSSLYLGAAAEATGAVLFSIDHHRGSEENQPGWEHHEPDLVDPERGRIDTLLHWRRAISGADLEGSVVGVVGDSPTVAARWTHPLAFCFIDGGHGAEPAWADFGGGRHGWPSAAGWPSTTSSPTPPTAAGRPTSCSAPRWPRASSSRTARAAACASCRVAPAAIQRPTA